MRNTRDERVTRPCLNCGHDDVRYTDFTGYDYNDGMKCERCHWVFIPAGVTWQEPEKMLESYNSGVPCAQ